MTFEQGRKLDEQILEIVRKGATKLSDIAREAGINSAPPEIIDHQTLRRRIDRSLQRLRRAGKIKYVNQQNGWAVTGLGEQCQP